jgi:hypothetical protein
MAVIPLKAQILTRLNTDTTLIGKLSGNANGVYPRAGADPGQATGTPFLRLHMETEIPHSAITAKQTFSIYVYDNPITGWGYWAIDAIIARLRTLLDGYEGFAFDGRSWGRCEYDGAGEEASDEGWQKLMKWTRFSIARV